jgi:hypothetical protein
MGSEEWDLRGVFKGAERVIIVIGFRVMEFVVSVRSCG